MPRVEQQQTIVLDALPVENVFLNRQPVRNYDLVTQEQVAQRADEPEVVLEYSKYMETILGD